MSAGPSNTSNFIELPGPCPSFQSSKATASNQDNTFLFDLKKANVADLRNLCKQYNLSSSGGNKQQLKDAITRFSMNKDLWNTAEHSPTGIQRRPHKGPREDLGSSAKIKRKPLLSRTRTKQLQDCLKANTEKLSSHGGQNLKEWADTFIRRITDGVPAVIAGHKDPPVVAASSQRSASEIQGHRMNDPNGFITPATALIARFNNEASTLYSPDVPNQVPSQKSPAQIHPYEIKLSGGTSFLFTEDDFVDFPVGAGATGDLDTLLAMWDDESPHWKNQSLLRIKSTPIAMKYWREFYSKFERGTKAWTHGKSFWHKWKIVLEEYSRHSSPDTFWKKFQDEDTGKRLGIAKVIKALSKQRYMHSEDICKAVSSISSDDFTLYFSYMKDGAPVTMTNPHGIRKRYEKYQKEKPEWFLKYVTS